VCVTCSSFFHEFSKNYHQEGRKEKGKYLLICRLGVGGKAELWRERREEANEEACSR